MTACEKLHAQNMGYLADSVRRLNREVNSLYNENAPTDAAEAARKNATTEIMKAILIINNANACGYEFNARDVQRLYNKASKNITLFWHEVYNA